MTVGLLSRWQRPAQQLRGVRVDDPEGVHDEGAVLIHGMIGDPEATFPPDLMAAFAPCVRLLYSRSRLCVLLRLRSRLSVLRCVAQ